MTNTHDHVLSTTQRGLLRALARAGSSAAMIDRDWRLVVSIDGRETPAARLSASDVEVCASRGMIAECGGRWRLSAAGRTTIRRLLATPSREPRKARSRQSKAGAVRAEQDDVLAWLSRHKGRDGQPLIGGAEFDAGERLRADFSQALLSPRITTSWDPTATSRRERMASPGGGAEMIDRVAAARQRFRRALAAVGSEHAEPLVDACCHHIGLSVIERRRGWPQRSGKLMLRAALKTLAIHYGLSPPDDCGWLRRIEIRHWGSDDYRPTIE